MVATISGTDIPYNINLVIVNDCPEGPDLSSITLPSAEDNPTVTYYIGRTTAFHLPQWTTSPATCALRYFATGQPNFQYSSDLDEKIFTVTPSEWHWSSVSASAYSSPFDISVTAEWDGTALSPVQTSTFTVQMVEDPCEPPTFEAGDQVLSYNWDYELRGQDPVVFEWTPLVFTPSHCKP